MPRKGKKFHYIYKTTNTLTGRYYIGMHSTDVIEDGYLGSGKRLRYSVRKYGAENHKREILEFVDTREELKAREAEVVNLDEIAKEGCMNLMPGGGGGLTTDPDALKRIRKGASDWMHKLWKDPEFVERQRIKSSNQFKKAHADGKIKYDTFTGKKHSEESKNKMIKAMKNKGKGSSNSQFGTCWITNEKTNKKIKKTELDQFINEGWKKGRVM
ncbi:MAG: hypothetical protein P8J32_04865 [bacterium]|nr:hypothetical protein [bacterium]